MKYLKSYKIFENRSDSDEEVKATIDDILLDLKDEGFDCHCNTGYFLNHCPRKRGETGFSVELRIYKESVDKIDEFEFWNGIEDAMNRIYSYISGISDKVKLYYINCVLTTQPLRVHQEEVLLPLEKDTLKSAFPEYYQKWSDGFTIYFEFFDKKVIHL